MKIGYLNENSENLLDILEKFNKSNVDEISHSLNDILEKINDGDYLFLMNINDLGNNATKRYNNFKKLVKNKINLYFLEEPFLNLDISNEEKRGIIEYFLKREKEGNPLKGRPNLKLDIEEIKVLILFSLNKIKYTTALQKLNIKQTTLYKYSKKEYLNQIISELSEVEKQEIEKFKNKLK